MIDLVKNTRKNKTSLWSVIGDKWNYVMYNKYSNAQLESLWTLNDIMANGRVNYLLNLEDRISQLSTYGYIDFIIINDLKKSFVKNINSDFPYEYKIYYEDLFQYTGIKVNYLFPPEVFTNTLLSAKYTNTFYNGVIVNVSSKEKWISFAQDIKLTNAKTTFKNYIFIDENDNPFSIQDIKQNKIFYKNIINNTIPKIGEFFIKNKFELIKNIDYSFKEYDNYLILKFKPQPYVVDMNVVPNNFSQENIDLYAPSCYVLDNFNLVQLGYPIGFKDSHYNKLVESGDKFIDAENKLFKIWKLNQRPYNFKQIFRLGAIIADQAHATTINGEEIIFEINMAEKKIKTSKLKSRIIGQVIRFTDLSEDLQTEFEYTGIKKDLFKIIHLNDNFNSIGLNRSDLLLIDKEIYKVKKILSDKYFEVDKPLNPGIFNRVIQVLSGNFIKIYTVNSGVFKPFIETASETENPNLVGPRGYGYDYGYHYGE